MPCILLIETSTSVCSVALSYEGAVVFKKENFEGMSHASYLGSYVDEAIALARQNEISLDAVAVSSGPGSYTGLRIGVSVAKGLCFGLSIPLISISTLQLMACGVSFTHDIEENALLCPLIDARRMEVYAAFYNNALAVEKNISADIIDESSYQEFISQDRPLYFFGDGAKKCSPFLKGKNVHFIDNITPLASNMVALAEVAFKKNDFVDVAYFEPNYLKEFQASTPKKRG